MNSFMQLRRWMNGIGLAALILLWTLPGGAIAAPLMITSAYPEASTGKLYIYGEGFGPDEPVVKFAGLTVSVLSHSDTALTVSIPYGLLDTPGTYLLSASQGPYAEQNSALGVSVGQQGPKGDTGPVGPKGDTGAQGPAGAKGDAGPAGAMGPKGDTGLTGPAGPKGATGLTGPAGPMGATGPAGPQGPKGDTGPTGSLGASCQLWINGPSVPSGKVLKEGATLSQCWDGVLVTITNI
jgi:hypothetical protein